MEVVLWEYFPPENEKYIRKHIAPDRGELAFFSFENT